MALHFMDGFDLWNDATGTPSRHWDPGMSTQSTPGRFGGYAQVFTGQLQKSISLADTIVGFAFVHGSNAVVYFAHAPFFSLIRDIPATLTTPAQSVTLYSFRFGLDFTPTIIEVWQGDPLAGGTMLGTCGYQYPTGMWQFMEVKLAGGVLEVRIEGVTVWLGPATNDPITRFVWYAPSNFYGTNSALVLDDVYICDTSIPATGPDGFEDFLGDVTIRGFATSDMGSISTWLPAFGVNTPANKISMVSTPHTDYGEQGIFNFSSTVGAIDLYKVAPTTRGVPKSIQVHITFRKDNTDMRAVNLISKLGGTSYEGPIANCFTYYKTSSVLYPINPATQHVWTLDGIVAGEFGIKIAS